MGYPASCPTTIFRYIQSNAHAALSNRFLISVTLSRRPLLYGFSSGISLLSLTEELHLGTSLVLSAHHWLDSTRIRDKVEQSAGGQTNKPTSKARRLVWPLMQKATEPFKLEQRSMPCGLTGYGRKIDMRGEIVS